MSEELEKYLGDRSVTEFEPAREVAPDFIIDIDPITEETMRELGFELIGTRLVLTTKRLYKRRYIELNDNSAMLGVQLRTREITTLEGKKRKVIDICYIPKTSSGRIYGGNVSRPKNTGGLFCSTEAQGHDFE